MKSEEIKTPKIDIRKITVLVSIIFFASLILVLFSSFEMFSNFQLTSDRALINSFYRVSREAIATRDENKIQSALEAFHEEGRYFKLTLPDNFEIIWPREFFNPIWARKPNYITTFNVGDNQILTVQYWSINSVNQNLFAYSLLISMFFMIVGAIVFLFYLLKKWHQDILLMTTFLGGGKADLKYFNFSFFSGLANQFNQYELERERQVVLTQQLIRERRIVELSNQVAHDIRSPLSAMEMLSSALPELTEEKRTVLRNSINRIRDIANSLLYGQQKLNHEKMISFGSENDGRNNIVNALNDVPIRAELFMPIVDSLVSEKRLQYRDKLLLRIEFIQTESSYCLFSKIQTNELKRVLSNLIDNAIESLREFSGTVNIILGSEKNHNIITIKDKGRGISPMILGKLGERGATFGKQNGSGLGIFHALKTIKSWGGEITFDSVVNQGTTVELLLPRMAPPTWFVPRLTVKENSSIVVLDDDQSIHEIWKERFEIASRPGIRMIHLDTPNSLRQYFGQNFLALEQSLFLIDYEILGHAQSGLDLIEELGIQAQSILVTSRFEEIDILERCERLKIKLIPKPMSGFVPIEVLSQLNFPS